MTIYIDQDFQCHVENDGTMIAVETDFFDGKCASYIEGYRYIPDGYSWTNQSGVTFDGEMIAPWQDIRDLKIMQLEYEAEKNQERDAELTAQNAELTELNEMLTSCVLEMSEIVYA